MFGATIIKFFCLLKVAIGCCWSDTNWIGFSGKLWSSSQLCLVLGQICFYWEFCLLIASTVLPSSSCTCDFEVSLALTIAAALSNVRLLSRSNLSLIFLSSIPQTSLSRMRLSCKSSNSHYFSNQLKSHQMVIHFENKY